jgi:environmental stress-induced protein Ves
MLSEAIAGVLQLDEVVPMPWKNKGGRTRELCVFPPASDLASFVWRASIADVDADGAFSAFDGIDRTIVLLDGPGFRMHVNTAGTRTVHDLSEPFAPFRFTGEAAVAVALHGGATRDFNLMVRRSRAEGALAVLTASGPLPADTVLLHVAQGSVRLHSAERAEGAAERLAAGATVLFRDGSVLPQLQCERGAAVIAVRIAFHV